MVYSNISRLQGGKNNGLYLKHWYWPSKNFQSKSLSFCFGFSRLFIIKYLVYKQDYYLPDERYIFEKVFGGIYFTEKVVFYVLLQKTTLTYKHLSIVRTGCGSITSVCPDTV